MKPWGTWLRAEDATGAEGRVITAMRFGCVLFQQLAISQERPK